VLKSAAIHGAVLRARLGLIFIIIILQSTPVFCCVGPFSMGLSFSFLCAHVPSGLRYKKKTQKNFLPPATTRYHPSRGSLGVTKASLGVTSRHHPPRAATGPSPGVTCAKPCKLRGTRATCRAIHGAILFNTGMHATQAFCLPLFASAA
jgi:hypothetical protein